MSQAGGLSGRADGPVSQSQAQQVLHVREDSDSSMDALFNFIKNKDQQELQQQTSYRLKKLPPSFFTPPRNAHSREGSQDGGNVSFPGVGQGVVAPGATGHVHIRSQSEPAQLLNFSAPPPPPQHIKQQSVDYTSELGVLPPGWDISKSPASGPRFLSVNGEQSWQDPRKSLSSSALNQQQQATQQQQQQQQQQQRVPGSGLNTNALVSPDLPPGWERGVTQEGEIYYINHITKTTSWYDPRIPKNLQRPGVKVTQLQPPNQQQLLQAPPPQGTPPQQLSPGQPQTQASPQGQQVASPPLQQRGHIGGGGGGGGGDQYLHLELQKIELKKEQLRREQDEIVRRERILKDLMIPVPNGTQASEMPMKPSPGGIASAMQSVTTSGMDPFLGQPTQPNQDSHARQNSADSGLGGMGTNYSLPRTPEDFLTNVEEMDSADGGQRLAQPHGGLQGMTMDIGENVDNSTMMDSEDDLVPSLQQDIGTELLNDIEIQKMDNLLWL